LLDHITFPLLDHITFPLLDHITCVHVLFRVIEVKFTYDYFNTCSFNK
jgi:hypothetical protein